jgi:hypothetical protein
MTNIKQKIADKKEWVEVDRSYMEFRMKQFEKRPSANMYRALEEAMKIYQIGVGELEELEALARGLKGEVKW